LLDYAGSLVFCQFATRTLTHPILIVYTTSVLMCTKYPVLYLHKLLHMTCYVNVTSRVNERVLKVKCVRVSFICKSIYFTLSAYPSRMVCAVLGVLYLVALACFVN